jgi:hypothetical protein
VKYTNVAPPVAVVHAGQNAGRITAVFASVPTFGPDGARIIAGGLPLRVLVKNTREFGR